MILDFFFKKNQEDLGPILVEGDDSKTMKHYILLINVALRTAKNLDEFKIELSKMKLPAKMPAQNAKTVKGISELDAFKLLLIFAPKIKNEIESKIKHLTPVPHIIKELLEDSTVSERNKENLRKMHNITNKSIFQKSERAFFRTHEHKINRIKKMYKIEWKNFPTSKLNREDFIIRVFESIHNKLAIKLVDKQYEYNDFFYEVFLRMLVDAKNGTDATAAIDASIPNWPMLFKVEVDEILNFQEVPFIVKLILQDKNNLNKMAKEFPVLMEHHISEIEFSEDPAPKERFPINDLDKQLIKEIKQMYKQNKIKDIPSENLAFKLANDNQDFNHFFEEIYLRSLIEPKKIAINKTILRWSYLFV